MSEARNNQSTQGGSGSSSAGSNAESAPGLAGSALPGVFYALAFGAAAAAVEAYLARYVGSYLAPSVFAMVTLFWGCAAAAAGILATIVLLPVLVLVKGRARTVIVPAAIVALGFTGISLLIRQRYAEYDALGGGLLLNPVFLATWGAVIGAVTGAVAAGRPRRRRWPTVLFAVLSIVFCAALSYAVWRKAAAYTLVVAPLGFLAIGAVLMERLKTTKGHAAFAVLTGLVFFAILAVVAGTYGEAPLAPIDDGFKSDPAKTAMLAGKPNVIIITIDTLRADHTSLCGYKYPTTPNLERIAGDCRFFPFGESAASWTLPAHASLFTGKYPREHGAHSDSEHTIEGIERYRPFGIPLAPSQLTLASYLSMKGYNTAGICANYTWLCRQFGLGQGFSYYYDLPRYLLFVDLPLHKFAMEAVDRMLGRNGKLLQPYWDARTVTRMSEDWLRKNKGAPFFLFINYMDPHYPYSAPPPFDNVGGRGIGYDMRLRQRPWQEIISRYINRGKGLDDDLLRKAINQYDGEIAYTDHWIGKFIETLKKEDIYDDTLVVITSDHGEHFGEHGLLNHGVGLYEGALRIPILVKYPRGAHAGEVVSDRVSIIGIFATVFDALKLPKPDVTAVPLATPGQTVIAEDYENGMNIKRYGKLLKGDRTALYEGEYKYLANMNKPSELYNLANDPGEQNDLAAARPEVASQLKGEVYAWRTATEHFDGTAEESRTISAAELRKLESLGYLGGAGR